MSEKQNSFNPKSWWYIFHKPSTIVMGLGAIACGILGYVGTRWLVTEKLPPFLEQQLSNVLERPLDLGEVESFSLNSITFGESTVSVNDKDPDYATVDRVKVGFNILPVIFRRVLPLEVTLIAPDIYLEQDKNGTWLELPSGSEEEGRGLPIDFDITAIVESGELALLPNQQDEPVNLQLDGSVNYNQRQPQYIQYDLDTKIGNANANLVGETVLDAGETEARVLVRDLSLPQVLPLLPNNLPLDLQQGSLNADLKLNFPSFVEIDDTRIQGTLSLQQVEATAEQLPKPLTAKSRLRFGGRRVRINHTQASIGDIYARVDGRINWEQGYDVKIKVPSFVLNKLLDIVPVQSTIDVTGRIKADFQLIGEITEPLLRGTISNTQPVTFAETTLEEVEAELAASLEKVVLEELSIIPAAGGEITGKGLVKINLGETEEIEPKVTPLSFQLQAQLPAEELLQPYYANDLPFNIGAVNATAKVDGTVKRPEVLVNWQVPTFTTTADTDVSGTGKILYNDSILTVRDTTLEIDEGEINLRGTGNLKSNNWQAFLDASNVKLNPLLQPLASQQLQLSEPVTLETANVRLNGKFTAQTLSTNNGVANLNLDLSNGDVTLRSELDSGNLNIAADAVNVPVSDFITGIRLAEPLDARLDLSANLDSIKDTVAINANNISIQLEEQSLDAEGEILLDNLANNPDITNVDLDLQANSNLDTLPNQLLNNISAHNELIAQNFDLAGNAAFVGQLQGENLLSNPLAPGNLNLIGDLQLENFAVGNVEFDPTLSGTVNILPGEKLAINLQGQQDVIAADLEPCQNPQCPLSYLPTSIRLRQGEGTPEPIVAVANREGKVLDVDVENFPLSLLNLSPAANVGIPEELQGDVTGEALVNLFTLATTGDIEVTEPRIDYIEGKTITADFAYIPEKNLAKLTSGTFVFGESIYSLQGALNLQTQSIEGQLNIPQAYIQDITSVFGWYDIERLTELFQPPDLEDAVALSNLSLGKKNARVSYFLKLLVIVQQRLEQIAAESNGLAVLLDIEGAYRGEVNIAGSLNSPIVAWEIVGNNWLWDTSTDAVLVDAIEKEETIAIDELLVAGNYHNGAIALNSLLLELQQGVVALEGTLDPQQHLTADYRIQDFPLAIIDNFVELPVDIAGNIDTTGEISGTIQSPELVGDIALENATLSDRSLPKITGEYIYNNARLELDTTETPSVQIQASIPFPIEPENDRFSLTADLEEGGVALIDGFTGGALQFIGGEGYITFDANGRLDLNQNFPFQDLDATGEIIFYDTTLKTATFTEPLNVTAEIILENNLLQVKQLTGTFANSPISATGVLPLLEPRADISNPLTLVIQESEINLDQLYEGGIEGEVIITGDAFNPLIGGEVALFAGQVFIPKTESETEMIADTKVTDNKITEVENEIDFDHNNEPEVIVETEIDFDAENNTENENSNTESAFNPQLHNFAVALKDFKFQQAPLYQFTLEGDLILNGPANNVREIQAEGTLQLTRADVDFVSSQFNLQRDYNNVIVFDPTESILNPFVDLKLQTEVSELADINFGVIDGNEIPDPISAVGRNETIDVFLIIQGDAEQIMPRIEEESSNFCPTKPPLEALFAEEIYPKEELDQLAECINANAFEEGSVRELLNSPAVNLNSNPPRSQGAILALLGNRFIGLAEQLQSSNEEQLLEFGVTQFVITPIEREIFNFTDETINDIGAEIGFDYFRVYPALEGTYHLSNDSSVTITYDYFFNELKLRYQMQF